MCAQGPTPPEGRFRTPDGDESYTVLRGGLFKHIALLALSLILSLMLSSCSNGRSNGATVEGHKDSGAVTSESSTVPSTGPPPSASTAVTTTTIRGPLGSGEPVTLAFAGDSSFQGLTPRLLNDPDKVLSGIAPVLGAADLTMVNLEAALGAGGSPAAKAFNFQTPVQSLDALKAAGVDLITMANNHGMDFGPDGLRASLDIKTSGIMPIVGIGNNAAEAYAPHIAEVKGQRIGFIGATDVLDASLQASWTATDNQPGVASAKGNNQARLIASVSATRSQVDTLVVYLHYGRETETCPNGRQVELANDLVSAGADLVVGSHAHRLQGIGYLGESLVAYGLGNFIFSPGSSVGRETGVLSVTVTGSRVDGYQWSPAVIDAGVPEPLSGPSADAEQAKMARLSACTGLASQPSGVP
ncbi:MAG: CapA family protein [Microthrixaceae bacterium]